MKITILVGVALLAMCSTSCVHSPARGGSVATDMERDWRSEFHQSSQSPEILRDWRTWPDQDVQPDYREVLAAPGHF